MRRFQTVRGVCVLAIVLAGCGSAQPHAHRSHDLDARETASLFSEHAELTVIGGATLHGKAEIARAIEALHLDVGRLAIGRQWLHGSTRATEFAVTARRGGKQIGMVGAGVATMNDDGLIATARVYLDVPTFVGQLDPSRLPDGAKTRGPMASVAESTTIATGSPEEAANFATTESIWAHLDAHDPEGTVATTSADYIYDDFSGPAPLDRVGLQKLLVGFLGLVQDFKIVEKPTYFAAGPYVVTESVEHMTFKGAPVVLHALDVKQFAAGKVVHEWQYANGAEVLAALLGVTLDLP